MSDGAIYIRDELVIIPHLDGDDPHIVITRAGEAGQVRVNLNEVRYLVSALIDMSATMAGELVGDQVSALDDPPLSCPRCGSGKQWQCMGDIDRVGWLFVCSACNFERAYAGDPGAT
jgi:hypothetical protein